MPNEYPICQGCGVVDYTQIRTLEYLMSSRDNPLCPKCIQDLAEISSEMNDQDWAYELDWDGGDE